MAVCLTPPCWLFHHLSAGGRDRHGRQHRAPSAAGVRGAPGNRRPYRDPTFWVSPVFSSRSRQGHFQLARQTRKYRKRAKLLEIAEDLQTCGDAGTRTWPSRANGSGIGPSELLCLPCDATSTLALSAFRHHVVDLWRRALRRCSQKDRTTWLIVDKLAARWLARPRITQPWPSMLPRQIPKVGAVCVNLARTALCGGRPVTGVPTALKASRAASPSESLLARALIVYDVAPNRTGARDCPCGLR
jgi:hypothetical protein